MKEELFSVGGEKVVINSVHGEFGRYLKEKPSRLVIPVLISIGLFFLVSWLIFDPKEFVLASAFKIVVALIMYPLLFLGLWFGWVLGKIRKRFIVAFARANGFNYYDTLDVSELRGMLYKLGGERKIRNIMEGALLGRRFRMFDYSFSAGSGRDKKNQYFGVAEITYDSSFPHILLQAVQTNFIAWNSSLGLVKLKLEAKYEKKFNLYVPKGYEVEALQLFSVRFLDSFSKHMAGLTIDIFEDRINIYDDHLIDNRQELTRVWTIAGEIIKELGTLPERLKDDFESLHPYYRKN